MWVESSAPSNIALIKYMGKTDAKLNRPTNSSLSFSLNHLRTYVRIRYIETLTADEWKPLQRADLRPIELSAKGLEKFFKHFAFLKREFKLSGCYQIESANNFPSDCGLASSASSFAALTLATYEWCKAHAGATGTSYRAEELAKLSQQGSGSSCRSFFSPWALWSANGVAQDLNLPYAQLKHQVILCDESIKSISSSAAHQLVLTSDLFAGRPARAETRLQNLVEALKLEDWQTAHRICWNEFWDMHMLFHTSNPAFMYMNEITMRALYYLNETWQTRGDGPLVTMDAGSNIHLLYRMDQQVAYNEVIAHFKGNTALWTDEGYLAR